VLPAARLFFFLGFPGCCMQMSYAEFGGGASASGGGGPGGTGPLPSWAQRANEPLVPALDIAAIKKTVSTDLKEVRKATDKLSKLSAAAKKKYGAAVGDELVAISSATRERARGTSRVLQEALAQVEDGSSEHRALTQLSEDFKHTLKKFTQQVEATSHLAAAAPGPACDLERGGMGCGASTHETGSGGGGGSSSSQYGRSSGEHDLVSESQQMLEQQMSQVATNEQVIADREVNITHLARSVQEVNEIFQDLALLVNEQGTQIDNIQTNIETAATRTNAGVRELARASRSQRRARGRMLIITACVLVLLIVLYVVLRVTGRLN
jgi:uncharacterized phage infection (PIP) family protein YhgE